MSSLTQTTPPAPTPGGAVADMLRGMPRSDDAERGLLSCFLQNPSELLTDAQASLPPDAFYHAGSRLLYEEMLWFNTHRPAEPLDIVTFSQYLIDKKLMDKIGGPGTLAELLNFVPTPAHYPYYKGIALEKLQLRHIIGVCTSTIQATYEYEENPADLLSNFQRDALALTTSQDTSGPVPFSTAVMQAVEEIEWMHAHQGEVLGLQCGLSDIDRCLNGFEKDDRIILGARPSDGKTSMLMTWAHHFSHVQKRPGLIISLDGKAKTLAKRVIAAHGRVSLGLLRTGFGTKEVFRAIGRSANEINNAPIFIEERSGLSIYQIESIARQYKKKHQIEWLAVDYIQLVTCPTKKQEDPRIELARVSIGLMNLAKDLEIPVIELAQLNRKADDRGRPKLSHLKECGQFEQDATKAILLSRDDRDWEEVLKDEEIDEFDRKRAAAPGLHTRLTIADIVKNKDGPTGPQWLRLETDITKFESFIPGKPLYENTVNKQDHEAAKTKTTSPQEGSADTPVRSAQSPPSAPPQRPTLQDIKQIFRNPAKETQPDFIGGPVEYHDPEDD